MMELKGLRGLQGLDDLLTEAKSDKVSSTERILSLAIDLLQPGKYQPRSNIDDSSLHELAASIRSEGIILPLIVRSVNHNGNYEIIAGERRWRAAKIAGLNIVPVIVRAVSDDTALAFALIENIQREALNPIDEALAFVRLRDDFLMTHDDIAERVGRSRSSVTNLMRLLGLHDEVKSLLRTRTLEMGHARALLSLNESEQITFAKKIVHNALSVRDTEKMVKINKKPKSVYFLNNHNSQTSIWEESLSQLLSSKVTIKLNKAGKGNISIRVDSSGEIERIISSIKHEGCD